MALRLFFVLFFSSCQEALRKRLNMGEELKIGLTKRGKLFKVKLTGKDKWGKVTWQ